MRGQSTMNTIREDFEKYSEWSCAECGKYAGINARTIYSWLRGGLVAMGFFTGPFRINRDSFKKYLRSGIRQAS